MKIKKGPRDKTSSKDSFSLAEKSPFQGVDNCVKNSVNRKATRTSGRRMFWANGMRPGP